MNEYTTTDSYGKYYYKDKQKTIIHREDGPAVSYTNGSTEWYMNDKLHRMDGPAAEYNTGYKVWYVNDVFIFKIDNNGKVISRME